MMGAKLCPDCLALESSCVKGGMYVVCSAAIDAPVTTALRPVRPPAKTSIIDCTKAAWVVTPMRLPTADMSGMAQAMNRNFVNEEWEHQSTGGFDRQQRVRECN